MFKIFPIHGGVCAAHGFFANGLHAGLKKDQALDVAYIYSQTPCAIDAIFTTNKFYAAPIAHFKNLGQFQSNFVLVNAKNANAMTGDAGVEDIVELMGSLQNHVQGLINPVMSSTGVIGVRLPKEKIAQAFPLIDLSVKESSRASSAIMTTDSFAKEIAFEVVTDEGQSYRIGAIAKGAGMIHPAMATMLCFITTDAAVPAEKINALLTRCVDTTFNAISVDGDTSTNDTVMLLANGQSGVYDEESFVEALRLVMHHMALMMVKDGEGAKKLVAFEIKGALSREDARTAAKALTNSSLVKTALFGEDPNWGRIASTIGSSGITCDPRTLTITFDTITVYERGTILFTSELEAKAAEVMKRAEFRIICDLGLGEETFTAYGCDLGYEYVKINADYRT